MAVSRGGSSATRPDQPGLFGDERAHTQAVGPDLLLEVYREAAGTAARLPAQVRFGTSSWSFPGWRGLVYSGVRSQAALARDGLREYARHPLLRTVGVDRSYYAPVPTDDLLRYAEQLPDGFPCCFKAPAAATSAVVPFARGAPARNPDFLSAERLSADLLEPLANTFRSRTGPIVVECAPLPRGMSLPGGEFAERLDRMLEALPPDFQYAVELRTPAWLTAEYVRVLTRHRAGHVYNYWSAMPWPAEQAAVVPPDAVAVTVVRLLLRPGTWYEDQRERFKPFDRLVEPDETMRGQVCDLLERTVRRSRPAFVLVNNKAEGSAPLTVAALASLLARRLSQPGTDGPPAVGARQ